MSTTTPNLVTIRQMVAELLRLSLFKMAAGRHLGFGPTGSSAIRSADLENPTLELNIRWIQLSVAEIRPFEIFQNVRSVVGSQYID